MSYSLDSETDPSLKGNWVEEFDLHCLENNIPLMEVDEEGQDVSSDPKLFLEPTPTADVEIPADPRSAQNVIQMSRKDSSIRKTESVVTIDLTSEEVEPNKESETEKKAKGNLGFMRKRSAEKFAKNATPGGSSDWRSFPLVNWSLNYGDLNLKYRDPTSTPTFVDSFKGAKAKHKRTRRPNTKKAKANAKVKTSSKNKAGPNLENPSSEQPNQVRSGPLCFHCDAHFSSKKELHLHVLNVLGQSFHCRFCNKVITSQEKLKKHEGTHTSKKGRSKPVINSKKVESESVQKKPEIDPKKFGSESVQKESEIVTKKVYSENVQKEPEIDPKKVYSENVQKEPKIDPKKFGSRVIVTKICEVDDDDEDFVAESEPTNYQINPKKGEPKLVINSKKVETETENEPKDSKIGIKNTGPKKRSKKEKGSSPTPKKKVKVDSTAKPIKIKIAGAGAGTAKKLEPEVGTNVPKASTSTNVPKAGTSTSTNVPKAGTSTRTYVPKAGTSTNVPKAGTSTSTNESRSGTATKDSKTNPNAKGSTTEKKKRRKRSKVIETCQICHKWSGLRYQLIAHLDEHTRKKNFKCTICSRSFHQECKLRLHALTHTEEKPQPHEV